MYIISMWGYGLNYYLGIWAQEMSRKFPNATVIGLDLTPPSKQARGIREEGLMYVGKDITKDLGFLEGTFDFIYQRDMATVVPSWRWAGLLVEFASILKPGGWIQLVECGKISAMTGK
jgi:SAM-dependent methyltransferase